MQESPFLCSYIPELEKIRLACGTRIMLSLLASLHQTPRFLQKGTWRQPQMDQRSGGRGGELLLFPRTGSASGSVFHGDHSLIKGFCTPVHT